ncbi:hypothetical protein ACFLUH_00395 [Chloroflexota bacterium]
MLAGKCSKCGETYVGWLLSKPEYQKCPKCDANLIIHDEDTGSILDNQTSSLSIDNYTEE